jgi:BMFP domain-containing protein YqiC
MAARYSHRRRVAEGDGGQTIIEPQEDDMTDRPRFFDDLASVAGGAFSAFAGLRDEAEALARNQTDEMIRRLDLVRKSELDAVRELAANARAGQEAAESRIAMLEARIAALEARLNPVAPPPAPDGEPTI